MHTEKGGSHFPEGDTEGALDSVLSLGQLKVVSMGTVLGSPRSLWHCIKLGKHITAVTLGYLSKGAIIPWWSPVTSGPSSSRTRGNREWAEPHRTEAANKDQQGPARTSNDQQGPARTNEEEIRAEDNGMRTSFICKEGAQNLHAECSCLCLGLREHREHLFSTISTETDEAPSSRSKSLSVQALRKAQGNNDCSASSESMLPPLSLNNARMISQPVMGDVSPGKGTSLLWSYLAVEESPKKLWERVCF